jgi:hypothetical protein
MLISDNRFTIVGKATSNVKFQRSFPARNEVVASVRRSPDVIFAGRAAIDSLSAFA